MEVEIIKEVAPVSIELTGKEAKDLAFFLYHKTNNGCYKNHIAFRLAMKLGDLGYVGIKTS